MIYDLEITIPGNGAVRFKIPEATLSGVAKLAQRVMTLLLADDGEIIQLTGGRGVTAALTDDVLARERSRVIDAVVGGTLEDAPPDEVLAQLELTRIESSGTRVSVRVDVTAESGVSEDITFKL